MKQAKQIFWNATLLAAASLLMRTASVAFGVVISNRAGAEAMGLFSLMTGVYGFALTLATSGIHLGVTRTVSETVSRGHPEKIPSVMRRACLYALACGLLSSLLLAGCSKRIALHWIKDARTVPSLKLFAFSLPAVSLASVFGGYFTAVRRTYKSAVIQVLEQALKIGATMYLLPLAVKGGTEEILCALVLGGVLSELGSFLIHLPIFLWDRRKNFHGPVTVKAKEEGLQLIRITLPMAVTAYIRSGLLTLEHILIPAGLRKSGSRHAAALAAYGSIHSMALPIVLYPSAVIIAFSGLLIPAVAECRVQRQGKRIRYMISRVWFFSMLFSLGVAGILCCFSAQFGDLLYPETNVGHYIRILAPLIPIMYVDTATDAFLKGLGQQVYSMNINIIDALLSVILVWILVPKFGIAGYLITVYLSESFNTVASITRLLTVAGVRVQLFKWIYKPLAAIVGATCSVHLIFSFFPPVKITPVWLIFSSILTLLIYFLLLFLVGALGKEESHWIGTLFQKGSSDSC